MFHVKHNLHTVILLIAIILASSCGDPIMEGVVPNDPFFLKQWHLHNQTGEKRGGINLPKAWAISTGSPDITLAIIDRGFNLQAADLGGSKTCSQRYQFHDMSNGAKSSDTHGQKVLGTSLACTENNRGIAGVDWLARGLAITSKTAEEREVLKSIQWAAGLENGAVATPKRADVINVSYGGVQFDGRVEEELNTIKRLNQKGIVFVTSSGNSAVNAQTDWLNNLPGVIVVGATNELGQATSFSNWGKTVSVLAPGTSLIASVENYEQPMHGTSFAAPIAAAAITLMKAVYPEKYEFNWKYAKYFLEKSAIAMNCSDYCPTSLGRAVKKDEKGKIIGERNARPDCMRDCCANGAGKNSCSAGLIDAHATLLLAQQGVPKVALADADLYYVKFSSQQLQQDVVIRNLGDARARVMFVADDANVKFDRQVIELEKKSDDASSAIVKLSYNNPSAVRARSVSRLLIETTTVGVSDSYKDNLSLFVIVDNQSP